MSIYAVHRRARIHVPLSSLYMTSPGSLSGARVAAGQNVVNFNTANTDYFIHIPITSFFPYRVSGATSPNLFGFRLEKVCLWYAIGGTNAQAHTFKIYKEAVVGNAPRGAATELTSPQDTVDTDDGASAALGTTARANLYKSVVTLATPISVTEDLTIVTAEWYIRTGATSGTAAVHGVVLLGTFGHYT